MSNMKVIRTSKLVNSVDISLKEYDPTKVSIEKYDLSKVVIDSNTSETSSNKYKPPTEITSRLGGAAIPDTNFAHQTRKDNDRVSKLCISYVSNKMTQVIRREKSMSPTTDKLEKVYVDLWGSQNPPSQSRSVYATVLICKYTQKTWMLYL